MSKPNFDFRIWAFFGRWRQIVRGAGRHPWCLCRSRFLVSLSTLPCYDDLPAWPPAWHVVLYERRGSTSWVSLSTPSCRVIRREAPVLLPAEGGFSFGRRPKVLLAVGELFVRARSARSQTRSTCVIACRSRVSIWPKAEGFARLRRALCSGAKRP